MELFQVVDEIVDGGENRVFGDGNVGDSAHEGAGDAGDGALQGEELVDPPAGDVGEGEEAEGLGGGSAVDDDHFVL